jgi:hypothetical protein
MLKNIVFYVIAGSVIAFIAQAAGANLLITLFLSLLVPPILLLIIAVLHYRGML